ncbi:CHAT domain-containing protein [Mycena sp. CBHHK59/15]|nr:CHAT domain-containing protein [Mycena sp. CBHHK59/15]
MFPMADMLSSGGDRIPPTELLDMADTVFRRFRATSNISHLNTAIYLLDKGVRMQIPAHPDVRPMFRLLATAYIKQFIYTSQMEHIQRASFWIYAPLDLSDPRFQTLLANTVVDHLEVEDDPGDLINCALAMLDKFDQELDLARLDTAIGLYQQTLEHSMPSELTHRMSQFGLAYACLTRFHASGNIEDLTAAIGGLRQVHRYSPNRALCLSVGLLSDPDASNSREAGLIIMGNSRSDRSDTAFLQLGSRLLAVSQQSGDTSTLNRAISMLETAEKQFPWGDPRRVASIKTLASALRVRFDRTKDEVALDTLIRVHRESLFLQLPSFSTNDTVLLACDLLVRFKQKGVLADLDFAIEHYQEALSDAPAGSLDRPYTMYLLAECFDLRFHRTWNFKHVDSAIALYEDAIVLQPAPHRNNASYMHDLASAVLNRFAGVGNVEDLHRAIGLYEKALIPEWLEDGRRGWWMSSLGNAICARFNSTGNPLDLDKGIELQRQSIALLAASNIAHVTQLLSLAAALFQRYVARDDMEDLDATISIMEGNLTSVVSDSMVHHLTNLALALQERSLKKASQNDLQKAVQIHEKVLSLYPNMFRDSSLSKFALALLQQFKNQGDTESLDKSISYHQEALALRQVPHIERGNSLINLSMALSHRFEVRHNPVDLEDTVDLCRQALGLWVHPHPSRGHGFKTLADCLIVRYNQYHASCDLDEAMDAFRQASTYALSSTTERFRSSRGWARLADDTQHSSALEAYRTAISLLYEISALGSTIQDRHKALAMSNADTLVRDAASCAVRLTEVGEGVEFLETGRSIFWTQALHLRTPLDELRLEHPSLAHRMTEIAEKLERGSHRPHASTLLVSPESPQYIPLDADAKRLRDLNDDWNQTLTEIRDLPRFTYFLRPKPFNELALAARNGPVVTINPNLFTCDALVVCPKLVMCISLEGVTSGAVSFLVALLRGNRTATFEASKFLAEHRSSASAERSALEGRLIGKLEGAATLSQEDVLGLILKELWILIVKRIFEVVGLKKSASPPRLWWCPSGPLAFLPLHAAGLYGVHGADCASEYVISSYTSTLSALLASPENSKSPFKMTAIIQPVTPLLPSLPGARQELAEIYKKVPREVLTIVGDTVPATIAAASTCLYGSAVVHFACHAKQESGNPLDSGLALTDGRLKVSHIMRAPDNSHSTGNGAALAFLSACETAKGDEYLPNEAMHLAATMLFAGSAAWLQQCGRCAIQMVRRSLRNFMNIFSKTA